MTTFIEELHDHRNVYKQAVRDNDEVTLNKEAACLTAAATKTLLEQNVSTMREVRAVMADLSSLADRHTTKAKKGDMFRALGDVLTLAIESGRPLEQLNLALPSTVSGRMLLVIHNTPGISPKGLTDQFGQHTAETPSPITALKNADLIDILNRSTDDKTQPDECFLTCIGLDVLNKTSPRLLVRPDKVDTLTEGRQAHYRL